MIATLIGDVFVATAKWKKLLLWGYLAVCCLWFMQFLWPTQVLVWCFGGAAPDRPDFSKESLEGTLVLLGILLALQALFLWGGGRVSDSVSRHQSWRNLSAILLATVMITVSVMGIFMTFADWADRFDSERSTQYHSLFEFERPGLELGVPSLVLAIVVLTCLLVKNRRVSRRTALINLLVPVIVSAWLHFVVALPTQVVVSTHLREGFLSDLTPSLFTVYLANIQLLWCVGVFVYLLRLPAPEFPVGPVVGRDAALKGGPYIDSAKNIASLLLIIAYFGITQCITYAKDLDAAVDARSAFSTDLLRTYLASYQPFQTWRQGEGKNATEEQVYKWLDKNLPKNIPTTIPWVDTANAKVGSKSDWFSFGGSDTSYFFIVEVQEHRSERPWVSNANIDINKLGPGDAQSFETIKEAVRSGIEIKKDEDFASLYLRTKNALLRKQVALPASGFSFPLGQVVWVCLLIVVVMLVLLQDRIRNVFRDPDLGRGEPWLILDAEGRLARLLSGLWTFSIFIGPCVLGILTIRIAALEIRSNGSASYRLSDVLIYLGLLLLVSGASVLSLKVIGSVRRLRQQQSEVGAQEDRRSAGVFE